MAETLRFELASLGVKVLSVLSGGLKTQRQAHFDDWKLPGRLPRRTSRGDYS